MTNGTGVTEQNHPTAPDKFSPVLWWARECPKLVFGQHQEFKVHEIRQNAVTPSYQGCGCSGTDRICAVPLSLELCQADLPAEPLRWWPIVRLAFLRLMARIFLAPGNLFTDEIRSQMKVLRVLKAQPVLDIRAKVTR